MVEKQRSSSGEEGEEEVTKKPAWEVRMDAWEKRMQIMWEETEMRWKQADKIHLARMERIDRRLDATSKLLQQGARILIQIEESQRELVKSLRTIPRNGHKQEKK